MRVDTVATPEGNTATRELVEHPGGVCVVPLRTDGNIVMERQYRRPFDVCLLEIPAGKLAKGEDPLECGKRELEEETGLCAREYTPLGKMYPSPGFCDEVVHMYLARDLYEGTLNRDPDELIELVNIPLGELADMALDGKITDAKTALAILKVNEMKNRGLI